MPRRASTSNMATAARRCHRRHIARVLLMAGRIRHDGFASAGREEAVRDVDGDTLLTLGAQAVHQQREVDGIALRAIHSGLRYEFGELVIEQLTRVPQ